VSGRLGRLVLSLRRNLGAGTSLERLCKRCAPLAGRLGAGLDLLAALSWVADFSVGCYCEDESRCHRSVLRELLEARGAKLRARS